jgi:hypothetical protein
VSFQARALLLIVTALSVSIGWEIRGQFGHEYGAALAGAIGGMAIALLSGRDLVFQPRTKHNGRSLR